MSAQPTYVDRKGQTLQLGKQLGTGGEGAVYEVTSGRVDAVAKVYHHPISKDKQDKLAGMASVYQPDLGRISAWPFETMHSRPNGPITGFVMPKVVGYDELYTLYSPVQRKLQYPRADWQFLIQAARNTAAAVATVHQHGHVIGDINPNNLVVAPDATIKLIDCDSFQIKLQGKLYPCLVGVPEFTPRELQGCSFDSTERTPNHDAFGLAVMIFHLLYMGRHPYAGRYRGQGDMPIARAIQEGHYAYSSHSTSGLMLPPPGTLAAGAAGPELQDMFERAFALPSAGKTRPTAGEWVAALEKLKQNLVTCSAYRTHKYMRGLSSCPWCALEAKSGTIFFLGDTTSSQFPPRFDLNGEWARIMSVPTPGDPPVPQFPVPPIVAMAIPGIAIVPSGQPQPRLDNAAYKLEHDKRKRAYGQAKQAWEQFTNTWKREAPDHAFRAKVIEAQDLKNAYVRLEQQYHAARQQVESNARNSQSVAYLQSQSIARAKIPGIGPQRAATLRAYGIGSAADITDAAVSKVPGFGPSLTASLVLWRRSVESSFIFDPHKGVSPAERAKLEHAFRPKYLELQDKLTAIPAQLDSMQHALLARREQLKREGEPLVVALAQAEADLAILKQVKPLSFFERLFDRSQPSSGTVQSQPAATNVSTAAAASTATVAPVPTAAPNSPGNAPTSQRSAGCGCLLAVLLFLMVGAVLPALTNSLRTSNDVPTPLALATFQHRSTPTTAAAAPRNTNQTRPAGKQAQGSAVARETTEPFATRRPMTLITPTAKPLAPTPAVEAALPDTQLSLQSTRTSVPTATSRPIVPARPNKETPTATLLPSVTSTPSPTYSPMPPTTNPIVPIPKAKATAPPGMSANTEIILPTATSRPVATVTPSPTFSPSPPTQIPTTVPTATASPVAAAGAAILVTPEVTIGVVTANANLRAGPGTTFDVVGSVPEGETIGIVARDDTGEWYQLAAGQWIFAELVTQPRATATPTVTPSASTSSTPEPPSTESTSTQGFAVIVVDQLNVRANPNPEADVVFRLPLGSCVPLVARESDWAKIQVAEIGSGWCWGEYVNEASVCPTPAPTAIAPAPVAAATTAFYVSQPFRPNAALLGTVSFHECFGSGDTQLRSATTGTPVQLLGTGLFQPAANEVETLGTGLFWKIRIWDGQVGWLPLNAVQADPAAFQQVSSNCEEYDRADWNAIIAQRPPTPTPVVTRFEPATVNAGSACCKICRTGKACGNTCISRQYTCHVGPGCACNG